MLQTVTSKATFGETATFNTDVGFILAVSADKKTFTATFNGLEAMIKSKSPAPVATRLFSFSIPLSDTDPGQEVPFYVMGSVIVQKGASANLMFTVNDQSSIAYLPTGDEDSFLHQFKYKATDAAEARVTVFLLVNRDSKSEAEAYVNVSSIDTDSTKHIN